MPYVELLLCLFRSLTLAGYIGYEMVLGSQLASLS